MRKLVDANIVLRYMLHDDDDQFPVAEQTIREGAYLLPEVLAEIVYVLIGVYSVPRDEIASRWPAVQIHQTSAVFCLPT